MEGKTLSKGSGGEIRSFDMDVPIMGDGQEISKTAYQGGTSASIGNESSPKKKRVRTQWSRDYYKQNPERFKAANQRFRERHRDRMRAYYKKYYAANKSSRSETSKRIYLKNSQKKLAYNKVYYQKNKESVLAHNKQWRENNREKYLQSNRNYLPKAYARKKIRRATIPNERIKDACRTRVKFLLRKAGVKEFNHTFDLIGCTPDFLKSFLEHQFTPEMSWSNYGTYWEIDHKIPVSRFNLSDPVQLRAAFSYSNCQPLEKEMNRRKNDTLPPAHQALLL